MKILVTLMAILMVLIGCASQKDNFKSVEILSPQQEAFWLSLQPLCGQSFEGTILSAPAADTVFRNKKLLIHIRACSDKKIRIPFIVGSNYSRTFVITKQPNGLQLKHDHRHEDGTEDKITMYGGSTSNAGTVTTQYFPADASTVSMLPTAAGNVWWISVVTNKSFTYNLRRLGSDWQYSIAFDLTKPIVTPIAPWGWKD